MPHDRVRLAVFWIASIAWMSASASLVWIGVQSGFSRIRTTVVCATVLAIWIPFLWKMGRDGVHAMLPTTPIRLAESRESLIVSIVLLVLIALVFIAYRTGLLYRVGFLQLNPDASDA